MSMTLCEKDKNAVAPAKGEDDVSGYLEQIRQIPRLTAQQEYELAKRCAEGDEEAIRTMVSANLRLVVSIAREYAGRGVPLLDLVQEGSIGLLTAAKKFDYSLNYRFSTYATDWIRQGIGRYIENQSGLIRVPRHTAERIRKLQKASALLQQTGEPATAANVAKYSGIPEEKVAQYLALIPEVCSLDTPVGEDGTLQVVLADEQSLQPQQELVRRELKNTMDELISQLPQRQQQVLRLRFGMEDGTCHSLERIGTQLGISKERARQIERQAMDRLHALGASLGLEDFLE